MTTEKDSARKQPHRRATVAIAAALVIAAAAVTALICLWLGSADEPRVLPEDRQTAAPATAPDPDGDGTIRPGGRDDRQRKEFRVRRFTNEQARSAMLAAIARARETRERLEHARRVADETAEHRAGDEADGGTAQHALDRKYIRRSVQAAVPEIASCYKDALETAPKLRGKLTVEFTISAEADAGGLVSEAKVLEGEAFRRYPSLLECVEDTFLDLEFPSPSGGGEVLVTYPLEFTPDD